MQDIEARRSEKQANLLDSITVSHEGQNYKVCGKLHCCGQNDAVLLRVSVRKSEHGTNQSSSLRVCSVTWRATHCHVYHVSCTSFRLSIRCCISRRKRKPVLL